MTKPIYLDDQSTTRLDPRVAGAMWPYLEGKFGNPHSEHVFGWAAIHDWFTEASTPRPQGGPRRCSTRSHDRRMFGCLVSVKLRGHQTPCGRHIESKPLFVSMLDLGRPSDFSNLDRGRRAVSH
jgi:hypothetical protein